MTNAALSLRNGQPRSSDPRDALAALQFRAVANPLGAAIDLVWDVPDAQPNPPRRLIIVRRERRFPGLNRRGVLPVLANISSEDWPDGDIIYDSQAFTFDLRETREERFDNTRIETTRQYELLGEQRERQLSRTIRREFTSTPDGDDILTQSTIRVTDSQTIHPGTIYYYTAFLAAETEQEFYFSNLTQASALATGRYGHQLFSALPQIHQQLDTTRPAPQQVTPADRNKGQLQRFLEVFEAHADMLHSFVGGLGDLRNLNRVDSKFLPHLADYIGWRLQGNTNELQQRQEIRNAPELYKTIGTIPTIKAVINRFTGWDVEVRAFARNVLLTFDPSRFEDINGDIVYLDGSFTLLQEPSGGPAPDPPWQGRRFPRGSLDTEDAEALEKLRGNAIDGPTVYTFDAGRRGYTLSLITPDSAEEIPTRGNSLVTVARINDSYSVRIFNRAGRRVIDVGASIFTPDDSLISQLEFAFEQESISELTAKTLIRQIASSLNYDTTDADSLTLDDTVFYNPKVVGIYFSPNLNNEDVLALSEEVPRIRQILAEFIPIQIRLIFFLRFIDFENVADVLELTDEVVNSEFIPWEVFITNDLNHLTIDTDAIQPLDNVSRTWFPT